MAHSREIIQALVTEDLYTAKKLINEDLVGKMGRALEDKLIDFGPTIFNEQAKKPLSPKQKKHMDKDGDNDIDESDLAALRNENVDDNENIIFEEFEQELKSLVEEIEEETGEQLSEEEIIELANELLSVISEESEEDEDEDEDEDEEETPRVTAPTKPFGRTIGGVSY